MELLLLHGKQNEQLVLGSIFSQSEQGDSKERTLLDQAVIYQAEVVIHQHCTYGHKGQSGGNTREKGDDGAQSGLPPPTGRPGSPSTTLLYRGPPESR